MAKSKKKAILEPEEPEEPEEESDVKTPPKGNTSDKGNIPYHVFEEALKSACITVLIVSKRNSGKSFLFRQLIRHLSPLFWSNIVVFSKTSYLNDDMRILTTSFKISMKT